jgi:hypothetical protein
VKGGEIRLRAGDFRAVALYVVWHHHPINPEPEARVGGEEANKNARKSHTRSPKRSLPADAIGLTSQDCGHCAPARACMFGGGDGHLGQARNVTATAADLHYRG